VARLQPTGVTPNFGTSSGTSPEENEGIDNPLQLDAEIPRGTRSPTGGLIQGKPVGRSPLGIEAGQSAGGGLNVTVSAPIGGPISARGGVNIGGDGTIKGGQIGLGVGVGPLGVSIDIGTDQDDEGRGGCYQYITVTVGFFSHTYGRNVCEPKAPTPTPTPTPPTPTPTPTTPDTPLPPIVENTYVPPGDPVCVAIVGNTKSSWSYYNGVAWDCGGQWMSDHLGYNREGNATISGDIHPEDDNSFSGSPFPLRYRLTAQTQQSAKAEECSRIHFDSSIGKAYECVNAQITTTINYEGKPSLFAYSSGTSGIAVYRAYIPETGRETQGGNPPDATRKVSLPSVTPESLVVAYGKASAINAYFNALNNNSVNRRKTGSSTTNQWNCTYIGGSSYYFQYIVNRFVVPKQPSPIFSPPPPNPPPKKKMDDKCCKVMIALQLETLRQLGREIGPNGVIEQSKKPGFIGEEFEKTKTPITNPLKPEKIKLKFSTVYEILRYLLGEASALDTALDPRSYKIPVGFLQNPQYSRDSEDSLKTNKQPDKDKAGNKRELEINKDDAVKFGGFLQQQAYVFEALKRLEYLFPYGELGDALIAKDLLIPGSEGEIKIHNMIQAYEVQMQYFNAALGNPREILTIKDANPAIKGDQTVEIRALSISDLLRQNIKFHIDTGGDVDALVNLVLRDFRTNMANRMQIVQIAEMTQALFEDSGMREDQDRVEVFFEGDVYAGQWTQGEGFKPNPDLEKKTEEATEKVLRETLKPTTIKVKVSRRHKDEKTDMRDLIRGLADFIQRLLSIPTAGDAANSINKLVESAKFKVQTEMALLRQNVSQAATTSRNRTKKRKKS
jgi:hypothetical protein